MNFEPIHGSSSPIIERPGDWWQCWRCGAESMSGKPQKDLECESCREAHYEPKHPERQRARALSYRSAGIETPCRAWQRDFDDDDNPIHPDGSLVAPGDRVCGHRDCIAPAHIISEELARVA